jgi:hypothetical protein
MIFAVITMLIAGGVEIWRQYECPGSKLLETSISLLINLMPYFRPNKF